MKPKNRVMCPDCGRAKMLFETEKAAQTFLKFNGDELNPDGTRQMRVYYCPACCGYHISSHEYHGDNGRTDRLIKAYKHDTNQDPLQHIVDGSKLYDDMVKAGMKTKKEVNEYLRKQNTIQAAKDFARTKYYNKVLKING